MRELGLLLQEAEADLPRLLQDEEGWHTLDVNYEPPHVERLWRPYGDECRLYLHRIHPCEVALLHPHPWPSAVRVVSGRYEMGVGWSPSDIPPKLAAKIVLRPNSSYVMDDPNGWHYVKPLGEPSLSVMVTGKPWTRWSPKSDFKLGPLTADVKRKLLDRFTRAYDGGTFGGSGRMPVYD